MKARLRYGIAGVAAIVLGVGLTLLGGGGTVHDDMADSSVSSAEAEGVGQPPDLRQDHPPSADSADPVRSNVAPGGEPQLRTVRGLVVGPLGEPLFANIRAGSRQTLTNSCSGVFEIARELSDPMIDVEAVGYVGRSVATGEGGDIGRIALAPEISSRVSVHLNGVIVPGATVCCWRQEWTDSLVMKGNVLDLPCLETTTTSDGAVVIPGHGRWVVYATWDGAASRAIVLAVPGSYALGLERSFRARIVGRDTATEESVVVRLPDSQREILLSTRAGVSTHAVPHLSTPVALHARDGRIQLRALGDSGSIEDQDAAIRSFECVGEMPHRARIVDSSDGRAVAFISFCNKATSLAATRSFSSYSIDGEHLIPDLSGDPVWVTSPGYESANLTGTERLVRLTRSREATQIAVIGAGEWSGKLVIRNGPITVFCGELRDGMLGPLAASMLPADVKTPDGRVLGKTTLQDGRWTVDASALGAIRITNCHELPHSSVGVLVGVWMGKRFYAPEVDGEAIRFLVPGLYAVGYAVLEGGKSRRLEMSSVNVVGGKTMEVQMERSSYVEGKVVLEPVECRAEIVYYPAWIENGVAELYGMESSGVESEYRWSMPRFPRLGAVVADRGRNAILGVLPPHGGLCRLRRVRLRTDLAQGDAVLVSWSKDDIVKAGWECAVTADGHIDVGWLPLDVTKCSVRYGNEGRVVRVDGSDPVSVTFGR